jgi:hypothetical protein
MSEFPINEHGVPLYPKGHAGRLLVTMAAIHTLDTPTSVSIAALTGLSQGNINTYVTALNREFGTQVQKNGPVYSIHSWGDILKKSGVVKMLTASD